MCADSAKTNADATPAGIKLGLTRDGRYLAAVVSGSSARPKISKEWLLNLIKQKGFSEYYVLTQSIDKLIDFYNSNKPIPQAVPVAEKRDATIAVKISDDKMTATVTIGKAFGGKKATAIEIKNALSQHGVKHGVQDSVLQQLESASVEAKDVPVALGTAPTKGADTAFKPLLENVKERKPKILENGMVDYRDLGEILTVKAGTKLMKRIPAQPGKPGSDILGNKIEAENGTDIPYAPNLKGVKFERSDPELLYAAETGQPIFLPNGVNVENVMDMKNIDMSTGNIVFDGSIHVKGDVKAGMKIDVTGDVTVEGTIEAATVNSGGNIVVRGSIIGHGELYDQNGHMNEDVSRITAAGSVSANITENVIIYAGDKILIKEQCSKCEIDAVNEIIIGGKGAKIGQLSGGKAHSGVLIQARTAGSPAGLKTMLEISIDDNVHQELRKVEEELVIKNLEHQRSRVDYIKLKAKSDTPAEVIEKANAKKTLCEIRIKELTEKKTELKTRIDRVMNGKFVIEKTVHGGTHMRIINTSKIFKEDTSGHPFKIEGNEIV